MRGGTPRMVCVVASPPDLYAIERTGGFRGRYHVLHGVLVAARGHRSRRSADQGAAGAGGDERDPRADPGHAPNVEGEATALYLAKVLRPLGVQGHPHRVRPGGRRRARVRRRRHHLARLRSSPRNVAPRPGGLRKTRPTGSRKDQGAERSPSKRASAIDASCRPRLIILGQSDNKGRPLTGEPRDGYAPGRNVRGGAAADPSDLRSAPARLELDRHSRNQQGRAGDCPRRQYRAPRRDVALVAVRGQRRRDRWHRQATGGEGIQRPVSRRGKDQHPPVVGGAARDPGRAFRHALVAGAGATAGQEGLGRADQGLRRAGEEDVEPGTSPPVLGEISDDDIDNLFND